MLCKRRYQIQKAFGDLSEASDKETIRSVLEQVENVIDMCLAYLKLKQKRSLKKGIRGIRKWTSKDRIEHKQEGSLFCDLIGEKTRARKRAEGLGLMNQESDDSRSGDGLIDDKTKEIAKTLLHQQKFKRPRYRAFDKAMTRELSKDYPKTDSCQNVPPQQYLQKHIITRPRRAHSNGYSQVSQHASSGDDNSFEHYHRRDSFLMDHGHPLLRQTVEQYRTTGEHIFYSGRLEGSTTAWEDRHYPVQRDRPLASYEDRESFE